MGLGQPDRRSAVCRCSTRHPPPWCRVQGPKGRGGGGGGRNTGIEHGLAGTGRGPAVEWGAWGGVQGWVAWVQQEQQAAQATPPPVPHEETPCPLPRLMAGAARRAHNFLTLKEHVQANTLPSQVNLEVHLCELTMNAERLLPVRCLWWLLMVMCLQFSRQAPPMPPFVPVWARRRRRRPELRPVNSPTVTAYVGGGSKTMACTWHHHHWSAVVHWFKRTGT